MVRVAIVRFIGAFVLAALLGGAATACGKTPAPAASNELTTATLIHVRRLDPPAGGAPDGLQFDFLVVRKHDRGQGALVAQKPIDCKVGGQSYQQATEAAVGRRFETALTVSTSGLFLQENQKIPLPDMGGPGQAWAVTLVIPGTKLNDGAAVEVQLRVGFLKDIETFKFETRVPPRKSSAKK